MGLAFDAFPGKRFVLAGLACAGLLVSASVVVLATASTPALGFLAALLRGLSSGVMSQLLGVGLAFATYGVERDRIGRALGVGKRATLAGTGVGPLLCGRPRQPRRTRFLIQYWSCFQ